MRGWSSGGARFSGSSQHENTIPPLGTMSASAVPEARPAAGLVVHPLRDGLIAAATLILAPVALDAVFLEQGQLLSPVLGKIATSANYVHEFAHDGRHLLGLLAGGFQP